MRGKKAYPEFVSAFISQCVGRGAVTPEEIVREAKAELQSIDDQIKAVEILKTKRSKLLDVIATFDQPEIKTEEAKLLSFFNLQYPNVCRTICQMLKDKDHPLVFMDPSEVKVCSKQLLETKVIAKVGSQIIKGERFDEYMKFVLGEKP